MDIVIIDADSGARDLYAGMLAGLFPGMQIRQAERVDAGVRMIAEVRPDLALIDFHTCDRPFEFFRDLRRLRIPFIVLSREANERIIVESMQSGAVDFVAKANFKLGYLKNVLARALLDVPRWNALQSAMDELGPYTAEKYRDELQRVAVELDRGANRSSLELEPGRTYNLIFQFCSINSPATATMDEKARVNHMNLLLDRMGSIVSARGGIPWMRKTDSNITLFHEDELMSAILSAVECQSALLDFATRTYAERPAAIFAMEASQVVYTKERGELISEAINLTAHMAGKSNFHRGVLLTSQLYDRLQPRPKRYFFRVEAPFEGHTIYSFEYTA